MIDLSAEKGGESFDHYATNLVLRIGTRSLAVDSEKGGTRWERSRLNSSNSLRATGIRSHDSYDPIYTSYFSVQLCMLEFSHELFSVQLVSEFC